MLCTYDCDAMQFFAGPVSILTVDLKSATGFHQRSVFVHSEVIAGPAAHRAVVKVRGDGVKGQSAPTDRPTPRSVCPGVGGRGVARGVADAGEADRRAAGEERVALAGGGNAGIRRRRWTK